MTAGPIAGAVRTAAHREPGALALADERGELTYGGPVLALLCRDHRGVVETRVAASAWC